MPIEEVWSEMPPTERVLSVAQFETLDSLLKHPLFNKLVWPEAWRILNHEGSLISETALSASADRSGGLQIVFCSDHTKPAIRYDSPSYTGGVQWEAGTIRRLRRSLFSSSTRISVEDTQEFSKVVDVTAPAWCTFVFGQQIQTAVALLVQSSAMVGSAARHSSIYHISQADQKLKLNWRFSMTSPFALESTDLVADTMSSWQRTMIQPRPTSDMMFHGTLYPSEPWAITAFRHVPSVINGLRGLFDSDVTSKEFAWSYEFPDELQVKLHIEILSPNLEALPPLYIFFCPNLTTSFETCYVTSDFFYLSFDSSGGTRLNEAELSRHGLTMRTTCKTLANFAVESIHEIMNVSGVPELGSPRFLSGWPSPLVRRCASVNRFTEYPCPSHVHYDHSHNSSQSLPMHEAVCDLTGKGYECICAEVDVQQIDYYTGYPKSQDRAWWIAKSIARWTSLLRSTGMDLDDLRNWYVEPDVLMRTTMKDPPSRMQVTGPRRAGISPWTVLLPPETPERGRSPYVPQESRTRT
ncbi:hypothetical protein DL96DRAFT_1581865 [Flagelloscypha sp. PMI_526]|nr:hypothetical protein DL96DRAFT_1581865 [Flagelloscypha sp. PMI_526]